jgi:hypothetical protein
MRPLQLGASHFLSNRLVPKEPSKIARRFNAGTRAEPGHKSRRDDRKKRCVSGVPAGLDALPVFPGVETLVITHIFFI